MPKRSKVALDLGPAGVVRVVDFPGISDLDDFLGPVPRDKSDAAFFEKQRISAIPRLRTVATWHNERPLKTTQVGAYTVLPGWAILEVEVEVHSSNNGSRSVRTLGSGLNVVIEDTLDEVYTSAIDTAGKYNNYDVQARLREQLEYHKKELRKYQSSHGFIEATVSARAHGSIVDRKRGWEEITVYATIIYLGSQDREEIATRLEEQFNISIP
jgi:hypothetical protein